MITSRDEPTAQTTPPLTADALGQVIRGTLPQDRRPDPGDDVSAMT
jgi:hypothetical protein